MGKSRDRSFRSASPMTLALQQMLISHSYPTFVFRSRNGVGVWRGTLQPRPVSPVYRVELRYKLGEVPRVMVLAPPIAAGAPHRYPDGSLCLYWPKEWHWHRESIIARTILPWASVWLLYYELWLDTGEWLGPSSHHTPKSEVV